MCSSGAYLWLEHRQLEHRTKLVVRGANLRDLTVRGHAQESHDINVRRGAIERNKVSLGASGRFVFPHDPRNGHAAIAGDRSRQIIATCIVSCGHLGRLHIQACRAGKHLHSQWRTVGIALAIHLEKMFGGAALQRTDDVVGEVD